MRLSTRLVVYGLGALVYSMDGSSRPVIKRKVINVKPRKARAELEKASGAINATTKPSSITIFIHGSRVVPRSIARPFFHCSCGLHKAVDLGRWYYYCKYAQRLNWADPNRFPLATFYTYCWSGDFSFKAREKAAKDLYEKIKPLVKEFKKKYKKAPLLRIIGHSHGVNVALNLVKFKKKNDGIIFDEMMFFGGPVQVATADLVNDPSIKKVYSVYSSVDLLQVFDPQRLYTWTRRHKFETPMFSQRKFKPNPKVKQVKLRYNGHATLHLEYLSYHFLHVMPDILNAMDEWDDLNDPQENTEYLLKVRTK